MDLCRKASPQPVAAVQGCPSLAERNPPPVIQCLVSLLPPLLGAAFFLCPGSAAVLSAIVPPPGTCHGSDVSVQKKEDFSTPRSLTKKSFWFFWDGPNNQHELYSLRSQINYSGFSSALQLTSTLLTCNFHSYLPHS